MAKSKKPSKSSSLISAPVQILEGLNHARYANETSVPAPAEAESEETADTIDWAAHTAETNRMQVQLRELYKTIKQRRALERTQAPAEDETRTITVGKHAGKDGKIVWVGKSAAKLRVSGVSHLIHVKFGDLSPRS